ncbi:hypothetical protein TNCV_3510551 [Trichonephila clavipes]|nr:hypothetical protein TNCV_3510551 [Trichonephila clavipes]
MDSYNFPLTDSLTYGGCYGRNAEYIKFISSDEHEIYIKEDYTVVSKTIKEIFQARGVLKEGELNSVIFDKIPSHLLVKTNHLIRTSARAPQRPMVMYTEMGTISNGPYGRLYH